MGRRRLFTCGTNFSSKLKAALGAAGKEIRESRGAFHSDCFFLNYGKMVYPGSLRVSGVLQLGRTHCCE